MKIKNKKAFFIFGYSFDILTGSLDTGAASATMLIGVRLNPHLQIKYELLRAHPQMANLLDFRVSLKL